MLREYKMPNFKHEHTSSTESCPLFYTLVLESGSILAVRSHFSNKELLVFLPCICSVRPEHLVQFPEK